jgi:hypothetical protein
MVLLFAFFLSQALGVTVNQACRQTSALTLTNFLGRSYEVLACLEAGFTNQELISLTDATVMNSSLAHQLREVYSSCIRPFEQTNYFLGYFANTINPVGTDGLTLGAGNTVSTAYVIARPIVDQLTFYTPSLQVSRSPAAVSAFTASQRPWYLAASSEFSPGLNSNKPVPALTYYPDAAVLGQNDTTLSVGVYLYPTFPNIGAVVALDLQIPPMPTCGGYAFVLRDIDFASIPPPLSPTSPQDFQLMAYTAGAPPHLVENVIDTLCPPGTNAGTTACTPNTAFAGLDTFQTAISSGAKSGVLYVNTAGTFAGHKWYVAIARFPS